MAYNDNKAEDGVKSGWNAADKQGDRTHRLQDRINASNVNLLAFNQFEGVYNYELKLNDLNSLFLEVFPKLSAGEKKKGKEMRDCLKEFLKINPIHLKKKNLRTNKLSEEISNVSWNVFSSWLTKWEEMVKTFVDEHGMNSPNAEDHRGL